jgi:hypothetical protein
VIRTSLILVIALSATAALVAAVRPVQSGVATHAPLPDFGADAASSAFASDPYIPMRTQEEDWAALSAGYPNYWQVRIPYRPVYFSLVKPRSRRTRRLDANPLPFSPADAFTEDHMANTIPPRL